MPPDMAGGRNGDHVSVSSKGMTLWIYCLLAAALASQIAVVQAFSFSQQLTSAPTYSREAHLSRNIINAQKLGSLPGSSIPSTRVQCCGKETKQSFSRRPLQPFWRLRTRIRHLVPNRGKRWRSMLLGLLTVFCHGNMAHAASSPIASLSAAMSNVKRRRRALFRVLFLLTLSKIVLDRFAVRRRQRLDPTSEWERYATYPGARGRALLSLLFLQVAPLYVFCRLLRFDELMAFAGRVLTEGLLQLGPLYCKLGQILSCRDDALPSSWIKALERLQDQIPAQTGDKAMQLAHTAWTQGQLQGHKNESLPSFNDTFRDFETKPLAAASLGQVHKAVLRSTNETVAIKLQRPFLKQIYDQDLDFLTKVAKTVDRFAGSAGNIGGVDQSWEDIILDAEAILYREIDYRDEAENGIRFCRDFGLDRGGRKATPTAKTRAGKILPSAAPWLRAPHVYGDLCSEQVLVMEFVPSIKITSTDKLDAANVTAAERVYLADCLGRAYLRQFCCNKFFSTDPHPGNLGCEILTQQSTESKSDSLSQRVRLVFYDFGQAATLTQNQADGILDIIQAIVDMDVERSIDAFQVMGVLKPNSDLNKVRAKIADNYRTGKVKANKKRLTERGYYSSKAVSEKENRRETSSNSSSTSTTVDATNNATSVKVRGAEVMQFFTLPAEYAFVGRALTQMSSVGKTLDAEFDFISAAAPWIYEIKGATKYLKEELMKKLDKWGLANIFPTYVDSPSKKQ